VNSRKSFTAFLSSYKRSSCFAFIVCRIALSSSPKNCVNYNSDFDLSTDSVMLSGFSANAV